MEKKEFKLYEAPAMEVVEMKMEGILCVSTETSIPDVGMDDDGATGM